MVHSWMIDAVEADDLRKKTPVETSALYQAIMEKQEEKALSLIPETGNLNARCTESLKTPLHAAAGKGMTRVVQALLDAGAHHDPFDDAGESPLHEAAYGGHLEAVKLLLAAGACIDRQPHSAGLYTPLMLAVKQRHGLVAAYLLQYGADPRLQNKWQKNAFDLASETNDRMIILLLQSFR